MRHKEHDSQELSSRVGQSWRLQQYAIADPEEMPLAARHLFSAMKYGDPTAVAQIAAAIAQLIMADARLQALVAARGTLWLAPSAYGVVQSAAACLADAVMTAMRAAGWRVEPFKIDREGGFERMNYGALGRPARERAIRHRKISITAEVAAQLQDQVVVVLDDLRCTGAHERAVAHLLAREVQLAQLAFVYCIAFEGEMQAEQEEKLNHARVKVLQDVEQLFQAGMPLLNARLLKFILRHPVAALAELWPRIGYAHAEQLYWAALSADGYFDMARFRAGFLALEEWLMGNGLALRHAHRRRSALAGTVVAHHIRERAPGRFECAERGLDMGHLLALYSRFKFGDILATRQLVGTLTEVMISALEPGGSLRPTFERAARHGEFISLTAPGVRNVISASNHLAREVGLRVNAWLSLQGLPTMVIRTLGRLSSGRANYAELSVQQRSAREKTTQTIIPRSEYQTFPSHVIFVDDVEVSGQTSQRARQKSLKAGALSFHAAFVFKVDPAQAQADAGIEHRMNQYVITGRLDAALAAVLSHPDYQPVQRMLRLLLHPDNAADLPAFLQAHVHDDSLQRIYLGAMSNDYLWIHADAAGQQGIYAPSLKLMGEEMRHRGLLDASGRLIERY
jgi:hypothetical protein